MGGILGFLSAPLGELVKSVGGIVDSLHTSDTEKLEAQRKLIDLQQQFTLRLAELDSEWAKTQADVIKAEANSQSWLARNWRPLLMLVFTYIIAHNFVIAPIFGIERTEVPPDMWGLLKIGMGGYIVGRSAEKIAPAVVTALKK